MRGLGAAASPIRPRPRDDREGRHIPRSRSRRGRAATREFSDASVSFAARSSTRALRAPTRFAGTRPRSDHGRVRRGALAYATRLADVTGRLRRMTMGEGASSRSRVTEPEARWLYGTNIVSTSSRTSPRGPAIPAGLCRPRSCSTAHPASNALACRHRLGGGGRVRGAGLCLRRTASDHGGTRALVARGKWVRSLAEVAARVSVGVDAGPRGAIPKRASGSRARSRTGARAAERAPRHSSTLHHATGGGASRAARPARATCDRRGAGARCGEAVAHQDSAPRPLTARRGVALPARMRRGRVRHADSISARSTTPHDHRARALENSLLPAGESF